MILYNNEEIKKIYENVNDAKDYWRVTNLFINICEEFPAQKTLYLYQISIQKYRKFLDDDINNEYKSL